MSETLSRLVDEVPETVPSELRIAVKVLSRCGDTNVLHFKCEVALGHAHHEWGGEKHWGIRGHQQVGYSVARHLAAVHQWPVPEKMFVESSGEIVRGPKLGHVRSNTPGLLGLSAAE